MLCGNLPRCSKRTSVKLRAHAEVPQMDVAILGGIGRASKWAPECSADTLSGHLDAPPLRVDHLVLLPREHL